MDGSEDVGIVIMLEGCQESTVVVVTMMMLQHRLGEECDFLQLMGSVQRQCSVARGN